LSRFAGVWARRRNPEPVRLAALAQGRPREDPYKEKAPRVCEGLFCDSRTCKPNSVCRREPAGRSFLSTAHRCAALATYPEVRRTEPARARPKAPLPPYLVLLRVGFALPSPLLERRCALTAPFHPYRDVAAPAVCFLWHFPWTRLEAGPPDVIRHTALWSSDFPLPRPRCLAEASVRGRERPSGPAVNRMIIRDSCRLDDVVRPADSFQARQWRSV